MQLAPNTLVDGKYVVLRQIGEGGMASVYEAENRRLGMRVALKLMHISVKSSESNVQRFLREASALASLNHPNIVRILDVVEHEGAPVLVMELLNGKSLGDLLDAGQRPNANDLFQIASQSLAALQHAHQLGIVHRDIKPDNIFRHVAPTGEATYKLVDFGIARGAEDHSLTSTGQFVGTRRYASPEQIRDPRAVDARTDLYSLGVTLWECVTGETPHAQADTEFAVMRAITEKPNFTVSPGRIDDRFTQLIERLTANHPNERFSSADHALRWISNPPREAPSMRGSYTQESNHGVAWRAQTLGSTVVEPSSAERAPTHEVQPPTAGRDVGPVGKTKTVSPKNKSLAVLLALLFGPFGLFYSGVKNAIIFMAAYAFVVISGLYYVTYMSNFFTEEELHPLYLILMLVFIIFWISCPFIAFFNSYKYNNELKKRQ